MYLVVLRKTMRLKLLLILFACLCLIAVNRDPAQTPAPGRGAEQVTVPLTVEGNRPFIDLTFRRADGSTRTARFLVDSGGGGFMMTEPLARDLGLHWGEVFTEENHKLALLTEMPKAFVGDFPLELNPQRTGVQLESDNILPESAGHADGMIPGQVLSHYLVIFDYPKGQFTLARANVLTPKGNPLPMPFLPFPGYPRTEIEVAGAKYGLLIDTGASFSLVSDAVLQAWGRDHPDWPRHQGAYGEAKMLGGRTLETMTVPGGLWGANKLTEFGVTSQPDFVFVKNSRSMAAPIVGSLAGNVLKRFRLVLDYPNQKLYVSAS